MHRQDCEAADVILSLSSQRQEPMLTENGAQAADSVRDLIGGIRAQHEAAKRRRASLAPMEQAEGRRS